MSLTLQDIVIIQKLIEVTQSRGAIRADEMHDVGVLYQKIRKIVTDAEEATKQKAQEALKAQSTQTLPTVQEEKVPE